MEKNDNLIQESISFYVSKRHENINIDEYLFRTSDMPKSISVDLTRTELLGRFKPELGYVVKEQVKKCYSKTISEPKKIIKEDNFTLPEIKVGDTIVELSSIQKEKLYKSINENGMDSISTKALIMEITDENRGQNYFKNPNIDVAEKLINKFNEQYVIMSYKEDGTFDGYLSTFTASGGKYTSDLFSSAHIFNKKEDLICSDNQEWDLGRNGGRGYYKIGIVGFPKLLSDVEKA